MRGAGTYAILSEDVPMRHAGVTANAVVAVEHDERGPMSVHEQSEVRRYGPGVHDIPVRGDFQCQDCGYGVSIVRSLPHCPMCGASAWEPAPRVRVRRFRLSGEPVAATAVISDRR